MLQSTVYEFVPALEPLPDRRHLFDADHVSSANDDLWRELIGEIGSEVAQALTQALERVNALATNGRIDRVSLQSLREEVEKARRAGMIGQQLARFTSGRIRQQPEALSLTQVLRDVLVQRGREASARGLTLNQALKPADVISDPTLLHTLLQSLLDWLMDCAAGDVDFKLEINAWPRHARLMCRFAHRRADMPEPLEGAYFAHQVPPTSALDSMAWRLVQQLARMLAVVLQRTEADGSTVLTIGFPRTVLPEAMEGVAAVEVDAGFGTSANSKPLAGTHLLVVASRREVRSLVRDAVRHMGLLIDFVPTVEEAEEFCRSGLPHAMVFESAVKGERLETLRSTIVAEMPRFVFIEVTEDGHGFELSNLTEAKHARVGREGLLESLPSALFFELSSLG